MAKRQLQVELNRPLYGRESIYSTAHIVTWIDAENAVVGREVDYDGQRWVVEKAYTTAQQ